MVFTLLRENFQWHHEWHKIHFLQEEFENLTEAAAAALGGVSASGMKKSSILAEKISCADGDSSKFANASAAGTAAANSERNDVIDEVQAKCAVHMR